MKIIHSHWYDEDFLWRIWRIGWIKDWEPNTLNVSYSSNETTIIDNYWKKVFLGLYIRIKP